MRCQYMLTNVKFNNSYKNVPYFTTTADRNKKLLVKQFNSLTVNFNFGNMLTTSCVVNSYNNENYMIVKHGDNLYFYFVTNCDYISVNQWRLRLELDVISQFCCGIHNNQSVAKCYIERAHIDRFRDIGNNRVIFNVNNESPLIESEMNFEKITKRRNEIKIKYSARSQLNQWLQDNILGWQYMYIDVNHNYTATGSSSGHAAVPYPQSYEKAYGKRCYNVGGSLFTDEYALCCTPIYKNVNKAIYITDELNKIRTKIDGLEWFRKQNADNSYIFNIKYSVSPPFDFDDYIDSFYISNNDLFINQTCLQDPSNNLFTYFDFGTFDVDSFGNVDKVGGYLYRQHSLFTNLNYAETKCEQINTSRRFVFNKNELKGSRSVDFEPKILIDCKTVTLRDSSNGEYVYPALYVGNNVIQPYYNESMSITNNNYYLRLGDSGIIPKSDKSNWVGIVNTVDFSQQIANNNYANFIANNKNFLLTKGLETASRFVSGNMWGAAAGAAADMFNVWQGLDNLQNKPNSMRNTNDSVELNLVVNDGLKLYVDEDEARDVDIYRYYNYLYNNGYRINRYDYIGNYIHTRYYFNYVKAQIDFININVPDVIENKIKDVFRNGVRMWNQYDAMYDYEDENREIWI